MIPAETKKMIDKMDYEKMLSLWRFSKFGDPLFQGETGDYFAKVMSEKRREVGDSFHSSASKRIGW